MILGKIIRITEDTVYVGNSDGSLKKIAIGNCEFETIIGDFVIIYEDIVLKADNKSNYEAFNYKANHKIVSISDGFITIQLDTGNNLTIPISELTFHPKLNELVEIYQDADEIIVLRLKGNRRNWFLVLLFTLIPIVLACSIILFTHKKQDTETVNAATTEQVLTTSTTTINTTTSTTTTTSTPSTTSSQASIIDTTAEKLRDMENDGTLKTGQLYRFTAELFHQKDWADYYGHFSYLNKYYNIKVKSSNASIAGIEIHIDKKLTSGWKEGQLVTFTVKIVEDSEKFQYWVVTEATPNTEPSTQKDESVSEKQEIDAQAILNEDYSSISGIWKNDLGETIEINQHGIVGSEKNTAPTAGRENVIGFSVTRNSKFYSVMLYPPGTKIITRSGVDESDKNQYRIVFTEQQPLTDQGVCYYRQ